MKAMHTNEGDLALLVVVLMLFGGGAHGPNRHSLGGDAPSASLAERQVPSPGGS